MNRFYLLFIFLITTQLFSQNLYKEPVATPAPFELQQNIDVVNIIQPLAKSAIVGDTTFFVREDVKDSDVKLESVEFYKLFENDTLVVYAEVAEYDNGNITDGTVTKIVNSLLYETPTGSVNPHKGILTNEMELLGQIPDVDNNGKLFVLLIDARDGYEAGVTETYVAGYFDPIDQIKSKGNYSDIIYIDTNPAKTTDDYTLGVVAHELQHLIHYNYDSNESTWLNEGFSELAPILLGYTSHSFSGFLTNTNRKLASFDGSLLDYSKVGLWTFYIYKRFGVEAIQKVLRNKDNDIVSYIESLNDLGFSTTTNELLKDWFLANLLNDETIENGKYSYFGEEIPVVQSEYFHSNFTEGKVINGMVMPQSSQYIQFNSGKNISLDMDIEKHTLASLAVVKHTNPPTIYYADISSGKFDLEDLNFGQEYDKLSMVLSWTSTMDVSNQLDFSYSAVGVGGYEEQELFHDEDTIDFYISLGLDNVAAEKFQYEKYSEIIALKFNCGTSAPVDLKIYNSLDRNPIKTYSNISSNYQEWTIFQLPEPIAINENTPYYISINAAGNETISLGYSETGNGEGYAFLKNGGRFYDLNGFSIDDGESQLEGNWLIRSIVRSEVFKEPELVVEPDSIFFRGNETKKKLSVKNMGTEMLNWQIETVPNFLTIDQSEGVLSGGKIDLELILDVNDYQPGVYSDNLVINSNINKDSVNIVAIKRNESNPQTGYFLSTDIFRKNSISMKVFNIGEGNGYFSIKNYPAFMAINPMSGNILENDTLHIEFRIDSTMIDNSIFSFAFDNGNYTSTQILKFNGDINEIPSENLKLFNTAPNPFVLSKYNFTNIMVRLKKEKKTQLKLYNIRGEKIKDFDFDDYSIGLHLFRWDGRTNQGIYASSGVYFLHLEQSDNRKIKKLLFIK